MIAGCGWPSEARERQPFTMLCNTACLLPIALGSLWMRGRSVVHHCRRCKCDPRRLGRHRLPHTCPLAAEAWTAWEGVLTSILSPEQRPAWSHHLGFLGAFACLERRWPLLSRSRTLGRSSSRTTAAGRSPGGGRAGRATATAAACCQPPAATPASPSVAPLTAWPRVPDSVQQQHNT